MSAAIRLVFDKLIDDTQKNPFFEISQLLKPMSQKRQSTEVRGFADFSWSPCFQKKGMQSQSP